MILAAGKEQLAEFLKTHSQRENRFAASLATLLRLQAVEVAERVRAGETDPFSFEEEHARLIDVARRHVLYSAELGAAEELKRHEKAPGDPGTVVLPPEVEDAILRELRESLDSPAWAGVTQTTANVIEREISAGILRHENAESIARNLRGKLDNLAKPRARAIARTEVTGALNAGHHAAREIVRDAGLLLGQEWLAIADDDVRRDHNALDGVKVGPRDEWSVGGFLAPYPGHWALPAEQRVNCRCTTIGIVV